MEKWRLLKKTGRLIISCMMVCSILTMPNVKAATPYTGQLKTIEHIALNDEDHNVVDITFNDGIKGKITFLDPGIFRYNVDLTNTFGQYADPYPNNKEYVAKIQAQSDDADIYAHPEAMIEQRDGQYFITAGDITIVFDCASAKMKVLNAQGTLVMEENTALTLDKDSATQNLKTDDSEYFYGGGTQNGRFSHKGQIVSLTKGGWNDGGVASPNPFYWSTKGYGVLRNTFKPGTYDFGHTIQDNVATKHTDNEFDAYYFVSDGDNASVIAEDLLKDYFKVTGNAALLPEYAYYLAHLNCYNRDAWSGPVSSGGIVLEDGLRYRETGSSKKMIPAGSIAESLNNEAPTVLTENFGGIINKDSYKFSARAVIDGHTQRDMPFGWFLPNDGYGCGYGQNGYFQMREKDASGKLIGSTENRDAALAANLENLKKFTSYANSYGVQTGLWTQSTLNVEDSEVKVTNDKVGYHNLRDFYNEVNVTGVAALKTDVAWVGSGYAMGLNSVKTGYDTIALTGRRPTLVSLFGWAGTQRYASIWTGDQTGGLWEYIRFHIPTYIGQALSGNPNSGSDMNGIYGGDAVIQTRDFQWKAFTQVMLDMDGWGSESKKPYAHGDPYTAINRMYLKLKAQLMPYLYTTGYEATNGLPSIRAMFLEFPEDPNTYGKNVQYQYMYGKNLLIAPIYQDTASDDQGNDIRNDIYLPGGQDQIWFDYFTGRQYRGAQTLNNFDAPIWKLPLFVKNGAIIPMYEDNNNPSQITSTNTKGLDKSKRMIEFWPAQGTTTYDLYEDDGISMTFETIDDEAKLSYGNHVDTHITSTLTDQTAELVIGKSQGEYKGYNPVKKTTFIVNVSQAPTEVLAYHGDTQLAIVKAGSLEEYKTLAQDDTKTVYYYDAAPNMNVYAKQDEAFKDTEILHTPKLYVKFARTDVTASEQKLIIKGYLHDGALMEETLDETLAIPELSVDKEATTSKAITLHWTEVADAISYDLEMDGIVYSFDTNPDGSAATSFKHTGLMYDTDHTYRIRAHGMHGYSQWSAPITERTLLDPWRNVPEADITWPGEIYSGRVADRAFDHIFQNGDDGFHSDANAIGVPLTIDMRDGYQMDKLEYYPRSDHSNGTVSRMKVEISLDQIHWKVIDDGSKNISFAPTGMDEYECMTWDLKGEVARYIRMSALSSTGGYFASREIIPWKIDESEKIIIGDINESGTIDEEDLQTITQYAGIAQEDPSWGQVKGGDVNYNGIYDVFDMSFTAFAINGGTEKTGSVGGDLLLSANKDTVAQNETVTIDIYGSNMSNVNALGAIIPYHPEEYEFVKIDLSDSVQDMSDFSQNHVYSEEKTAYITLSLLHVGDQPLLAGTSKIATITMKALRDGKALNPKEGMLIGPDHSLKISQAITVEDFPDIPEVSEVEYVQDDFNITITNEYLPTDDGDNVKKLIQQNSYANLFNDIKEYQNNKVFEFKWDTSGNYDPATGKLWNYVTLPTTLHFAFKTPSKLTQVDYYNRHSSNGSITALSAEITFEDETTQKYSFTTRQDVYSLVIADDNLNKKVVRVDITPEKSSNMQMLTILEIDFLYNDTVKVKDIALDENNPDKLYMNRLYSFQATVIPENATNQYVQVTSQNTDVVRVIQTVDEDGKIQTSLLGLQPGTAMIHVESLADSTIYKDVLVQVSAVADTTQLQSLLDQFHECYENLYTMESYDAASIAAEAASLVLADAQVTQDEVDSQVLSLQAALDALVLRGSNEDQASSENLISNEAFTLFDETSYTTGEKEHGERAFDGDITTIWHSNYNGDYKLPQWITVDLGAVYELEQVDYLPRQNNANGHITHYRIDVSCDGETFVPLVEGLLPNNGKILDDHKNYKEIKVDLTKARYVRFIALESLGTTRDLYASIAELQFYGLPVITLDTILAKAESIIDSGSEDQMTTSSWQAFINAYHEALTLLNQTDPKATNEELQIAGDLLTSAQAGLKSKAADYVLDRLAGLITEYKALEPSYTESDFAAMKEALQQAELLLQKGADDISGEEAAMMSAVLIEREIELQKAMSAEKLISSLQHVLENAEMALNDPAIENVRPGKVSALQDAVATGKALIESGSKDQELLTAAIQTITEAMQELYEIIDKSAIQMLLDKARTYDEAMFTADSWNALQDAMNFAETVVSDRDADSDTVKNAYLSLVEAMNHLQVRSDMSALKLQIEEAEKIKANLDRYVPRTVKDLDLLLEEAYRILEDEDVTQSEIDEMTVRLTEFTMGARLKADKTQLVSIRSEVMKLTFDDYSDTSVQALFKVMDQTQALLADEEASQEAIDAACLDLQAALKDLERIAIKDPQAPQDPVISDKTDPANDQLSKEDALQHYTLPSQTPAKGTTKIVNGVRTSDPTNAAGFILLLMFAGCCLCFLRKKMQ